MNQYVVGFAFNETESALILMLKARPDWQVGLLNGVGGHIEGGESAEEAMAREWEEETGGSPVTWTLFAKLTGASFAVYFFRGNSEEVGKLESGSEGESIVVVSPDTLPENVVSNLRWLIPMSRTSSKHDWPYEIRERAQGLTP